MIHVVFESFELKNICFILEAQQNNINDRIFDDETILDRYKTS